MVAFVVALEVLERALAVAGGAAVVVVRDLARRVWRRTRRCSSAPGIRCAGCGRRSPTRRRALDATLIVLDPDVMEPDEATAIGEWVRAGGRLVAGGTGDSGWLEEVIGEVPRWGETAACGEPRSCR